MRLLQCRLRSLLVAAAFCCLLTVNIAEAARGLRTREDEPSRTLKGGKGTGGKGNSHSNSHSYSHSISWSHSNSHSGSHSNSHSSSGQSIKIKAYASGFQEVSEVDTRMKAMITLEFAKDLSYANYRVQVQNGYQITQAQLQCQNPGSDGAVITTLFYGPTVTIGTHVTTLAQGTITAASLSDVYACSWFGYQHNVLLETVAGLLEAIDRGFVYLNVQTAQNSNGEVRAQIYLLKRFS